MTALCDHMLMLIMFNEYLCVQKRCMTHGEDSGLQYILPYSDTLADSREWHHTFLHLNSSCRKSSSHKKAQRSQQDSGM